MRVFSISMFNSVVYMDTALNSPCCSSQCFIVLSVGNCEKCFAKVCLWTAVRTLSVVWNVLRKVVSGVMAMLSPW